MNTRSRFTLSTVVGLALAGFCLSSAQAQMTKKMMKHEAEMIDERMIEPVSIGYPFAAPGGLHLYHYTDFSMEGIEAESATMKKMDNMKMRDDMMRDQAMIHEDRMMYEGHYMTDENGMTMREEDMMEPAPIGYPFSGPGALHLYHFTDYTMEGLAEESASMKKMDNMKMRDDMMRDHMMYRDGHMMMDENDMSMDDEAMVDPAPLGYPFAAPGALHLYHFTDYSMEAIAEQSSTMQKMDNMQKMDQGMKMDKKMKRNKMPK